MKRIIFLLILAGMTVLSGCDNWLDVQPADRLPEKQVFNSESGFLQALNGVYQNMLSSSLYGSTLSYEFIEIMAQRYNIVSKNTSYTEVVNYNYGTDYCKTRIQSLWNDAYTVILNCNNILENAEKQDGILTQDAYRLIVGEALAVRAYLHLDLLRLFGPIYSIHPESMAIPYAEKVSVSAPELLRADTVLLNRIIRDLTVAEELLKASDPIVSEGPLMSSGDDNSYRYRGLRMNYYAVMALKARAYLYGGMTKEAREYALKVIDDPNRETYFPFVDLDNIKGESRNPDRVFSTEILFSLFNWNRGSIFNSYFDAEKVANNLLIPKKGVITQLFANETGDIRFAPLWEENSKTENGDYACVKYKNIEQMDTLWNTLIPMVRLSEMYLIAAECAESETEAYGYLNTLRNHRSLEDVSEGLEDHLLKEYTKEFVCEGQLFFYYKRKNMTKISSGIGSGTITLNDARYVLPFPDSENQYRTK